jgi:predicted dehydrogenase
MLNNTFNQLDIYIVGYGRAGKIHAQAYKKLADRCKIIAVIEPEKKLHSIIIQDLGDVIIYNSIDEIGKKFQENVVFDFCVPAPLYIELSKKAQQLNVKKMFFEKPISWSFVGAKNLVNQLDLVDTHYLDSYRYSKGIIELKNLIREQNVQIEKIDIKFYKNRILDSLNQRGFHGGQAANAWYIEGPHMISIALFLNNDIKEIESVKQYEMQCGNYVHETHGGAKANILHTNDSKTFLNMNLVSDKNIRTVDVYLKNNISFHLSLPISKSVDFVSTLETYENNNFLKSYTIEDDRPMELSVINSVNSLFEKKCNIYNVADGLKINGILNDLIKKSNSE